ncbi:hypothetical protein CWATWH0402_3453 [Crocosphaera watsonii WH 0402]|uniref:Uncharacterized protein n=1 Tax=Crocosphaera watsonii WH 0402 TaxID=1284629 RepID=T2JWU0_CROWT|nr:hypothetical protein [Crocosphaera watsonii]CCQ69680.1 hypothetical protein CWATWH0402_3453 [Crocosphaera watsonii WH 0402]
MALSSALPFSFNLFYLSIGSDFKNIHAASIIFLRILKGRSPMYQHSGALSNN